jgi:hypothetical protein
MQQVAVAEPTMAGLPPVDEATKAQAAREIAMQDAGAPAISPLPAAAIEQRRVPQGNASFEVSASDYPSLHSVPPRPALDGPNSSKERLSETQSTLQQDMDAANASRDALARDAAAEPSMLPQAPQPVAAPKGTPLSEMRMTPLENQSFTVAALPPEQPIGLTPEPLPELPPQRIALPANADIASSNLPSTPTFAPPAPLNAQAYAAAAAAPEPLVVAKAPTENPQPVVAMEVAPAPVVQEFASAPEPQPAPQIVAVATSTPAVSRGDFDPMAPVEAKPYAPTVSSTTRTSGVQYASSTYLPASRYAERAQRNF